MGAQIAAHFANAGIPALLLDVSRDAARAGLERARGILAASDSDSDNLYIVLSARAQRPDLTIVARASNPEAEKKLRLAGADRVVQPYSAAGVEMAKPFGFETVQEAIASTTEGLDYFMSRGITPRFTTWCPEPTTPLGRDNPDGAPLEYHIRLLEAYRETLEKHGLKPPPGYGVAGAGNAVFSVSSFMDTLAPEVVTTEEAVPA